MSVFISAGHDLKHPGASANGFFEEKEMIEFRNKVVVNYELMYPGSKVITDGDNESLADYLKRIQTGDGSVVVEFHLDAFDNPTVSGISAWVGNDADKLDKAFANELCKIGAGVLEVPNRGVFPESESYHKKLGLMRERGTVCLVEIVPITNKADMEKFHQKMNRLAVAFAGIVYKYERMIV